jgi:hypothetical protein
MMDGGVADLVWCGILALAFWIGWCSEHGW